MFMIVFSFLKSFFSGLIEFFNTKIGMIVLGVIIVIASVYFANRKCFNDGVEYQKQIDNENYIKQLNILMKEYDEKQKKAFEDGLNSAKKEKEIITIYEKSKPVVENITKKYKDIKMEQNDFDNLMNEVRKINE